MIGHSSYAVKGQNTFGDSGSLMRMVMDAMKESGVTACRHVEVNRRQSPICLDLNSIISRAFCTSFCHPLTPHPAVISCPFILTKLQLSPKQTLNVLRPQVPLFSWVQWTLHKIARTATPQPLFSAFHSTVSVIITTIPKRYLHL